MNDVPVKEVKVPRYSYWYDGTRIRAKVVGYRTNAVLDIQELFRDDPVGLEKYQERLRGIERRLDKVIRRKRERQR